MMRSLFAAVSGLKNHQTRMDVIGNNIANVNTIGFKASRVTFEESLSQLVQSASRPPGGPQGSTGGTNPMQVGLGMSISSIDQIFTQGNLEATGITTDLAIQGPSFFVVSDGSQNLYSRAGNFKIDSDGRLVLATNGYVVQGRVANAGVLTQAVGDIRLPFGQKSAAQPTANATLGGNLDAAALVGDSRQTSIAVMDAQGGAHDMTITFTKTAANTWDYGITVAGAAVSGGAAGTVTFDNNGALLGPANTALAFTPTGFTAAQTVTVEFGTPGDIDGISQFASPSTALVRDQDGFPMGDLTGIGIEATGIIQGSFTNGETLVLGQIALADFNNPSGMMRLTDNLYTTSANSGNPVIGFNGEGSQSYITSGALEMSNVDLAQEFTNMITTQRGFQSNARVITTSDEMLQELVNLRR
ncbi:MAG: flagellar hook protein FlgE [Longimicrobiales bacterium]